MMNHTVTLRDGAVVPALGQGTWCLGEHRDLLEREEQALRAGIDAGMTLLDTAEMYGDGLSEELIGRTIRDIPREQLFLVSKVYPHNAGRRNIFTSCENSLRRMGVDYIDLYLLHWRGSIPLAETVLCMEQLKKEGKILRWGVSNFDTDDMNELWRIPGGDQCAVNQVLYHIASRGIEYDLLPWMREHDVTLMAYCPLAQAGGLRRGLYHNRLLLEIAEEHNAAISQILLAFAIRDGHTIAIPRTGKSAHTIENAGADAIDLTEDELREIGRIFPAPTHKTELDMQ